MSRRRRQDEYIPIKIEGWNGKFVYDKNPEGTTTRRGNQSLLSSNTDNFFAYAPDKDPLPPRWDGNFAQAQNVDQGTNKQPVRHRIRQDLNQSDTSQFYGFCTEPEILPSQWSGKFATDPSDVRIMPERNRSEAANLHGYTNETEILPTEWDGRFQIDPNDIRIKPERNCSDVRDYAEANRFTMRNHNGQ